MSYLAQCTEQDTTIFVAPVITASTVEFPVFQSGMTVLSPSVSSATVFGVVTGSIQESFTISE